MKNLALAFLMLSLLSACDEMAHQRRYDSYERSGLFPDGKSLQAPPDGTIARDDPAVEQALTTRPPMSLALLQRGQERYGIDCSPCHDAAGYGNGTVVSRGFPHPPSLHDDRLKAMPSAEIVDVITYGHGVMYSYADRVSPADRWAIVGYIRALQLSQDASVDALAPVDRNQLGVSAE